MSFPLLLRELCVLCGLCVKSFSLFLRFMVMLFLRRRACRLFLRQDGFVFLVRQNADHRHHSHHSRAPIFRQAVGFGLFHHFVHPHFHEGILRKTGHALSIWGDRGRMHVLERHASRKRLHLTHGLCLGLVGGLICRSRIKSIMLFIMWCGRWQWIIQAPGYFASNSTTRACATPTSTVFIGYHVDSGARPPSVPVTTN